jgi:hydroxymethylglutaryl-CoA synthase
VSNPVDPRFDSIPAALKETMLQLTPEASYSSKDVESTFVKLSGQAYTNQVEPSLLLPRELGNSYTASLYTGLQSLIAQKTDQELKNKRLFMFSYGR